MSSAVPDFRETCWSLVQAPQGTPADRTRFDRLCLRYWPAVAGYLRRRGLVAEQADRVTRAFFDSLQREGLARVHGYARFRVFLLDELQRFLADTASSPPDAPAAAHALHRGFALEVIGHAMTRLREEAERNGRAVMFERLQPYLGSVPANDDYRREADALGARPVFVAMAVQRLRQRFRQLVDEELAQLVSNATEFANERESLLQALERA